MTSLYLIAAGIVVCIALSFFFSSSEMAYSSCNTMRLENLSEEGDSRAKAANYIVTHYNDALSTILIGNNLVNIAGSSLASLFVMGLLGSSGSTWISTIAMTILVIIFGETIPKITAKKSANRVALSYAYVTRTLMIILWPVVKLVVLLIKLITLPMKGEKTGDPDEAVEELQNIIETAEDEEVLDEERSELVRSAIDFSEISASEVMTARVDVGAIDIDDPWEDILDTVEESPYSRLPVYQDSIDNIIGILSLNRFLKAMADNGRADIKQLLMPAIYVYKTAKLPDVLNKFRSEKQHLAIVVDEYGGTLGVVSMEDVLETIVGDIWDDTDTVEQEIVKHTDNVFEVDGDMNLADFMELCSTAAPGDEFESETAGGWCVEMFGDFPKAGDSFDYNNLHVTVLGMDGLRVEKLLVEIKTDSEESD